MVLPIPRAEAERRDGVLRAYLTGLDWDLSGETALRRHLVLHSHALVPDHRLLIGLEWVARTGHAGDLLFYDGERAMAAVEIKVTEKVDVARRLHKVETQARDFARAARARFPWALVQGMVYTSIEHRLGVGPRLPLENRPIPKGYTPQALGVEEK